MEHRVLLSVRARLTIPDPILWQSTPHLVWISVHYVVRMHALQSYQGSGTPSFHIIFALGNYSLHPNSVYFLQKNVEYGTHIYLSKIQNLEVDFEVTWAFFYSCSNLRIATRIGWIFLTEVGCNRDYRSRLAHQTNKANIPRFFNQSVHQLKRENKA